MTSPYYLGRRAFLARLGVLAAALGSGGLLTRDALAQPGLPLPGDPLSDLVGQLRPVLAELARDTINGLTTFAVPGPDAYSQAQGTPRDEPGALEAGSTDFLIDALDNFVPFPDQLAKPITAAVATGLSDSGITLPGLELLAHQVETLDEALRTLLENDEVMPLSLAVAMLLNLVATQVNPAAVNGVFLSPFARLSYAEKAAAFQLLEGADADLVALLDTNFPEPSRAAVSGMLKFVAGALLEFATFGGYAEHAVFDPETRELTARPVGWELTGYQPDGPVEGWDEFKGYYQGRREVRD